MSDIKLKKTIGFWQLYFFIIGDTVGAAVYVLVGKISAEVGAIMWLPLILALGLAMFTAASYAELVTKYPCAGGAAVFAERAYNQPALSFLVGFSMLAAGVTSAAGLAVAFAGDYLKDFMSFPMPLAIFIFFIFLGSLNIFGIKESLIFNTIMTIIKLTGLLTVIALVAFYVAEGNGNFSRITEFKEGVSPWSAVLAAIIICFYSFVGFETSANIAEEVKDIYKDYPKALFTALLTAGFIYIGIALVSSLTVDSAILSHSSAPLLVVVKATQWGIPTAAFSLVALIAVTNTALLTLIMCSRLSYGMAKQKLLPEFFAKVSLTRKTPWVAIIFTTFIAFLLSFTGALEDLTKTVVLFLLLVFFSTNIAVLKLRKEKVEHKHFHAPSVLPYLAICSCLLLMSQVGYNIWLRAIILWVPALLYYFVVQRKT